MVATDLAGRGIDVPDIENVIKQERGAKRETDKLSNKEKAQAALEAKIKALENVIAQEKGISRDQLKSKIMDARKAQLDQAVAAGKLSTEQAQQIMTRMSASNAFWPSVAVSSCV